MDAAYFPPMNREMAADLKQRPAFSKARDMQDYALKTWLPWVATHFPIYVYDLMCLRMSWLLAPRGCNDELSTPNI